MLFLHIAAIGNVKSKKTDNLAYRQLNSAIIACLVIGFLWLGSPATTVARTNSLDLVELSLEDLTNIEVTSVSKKTEKLKDAPAAIYVITGEDIKRSGYRSIPEALRMVPGLHVGRLNSSTWAVSARGFNSQFANKLLVLIDGRSVYTPLFSGVYWDVQNVVMEDIDRIEVIRGPGATLWGANAVNGVINIITKKADETQGTFIETGGGTEEQYFMTARHGNRISENAFFRVYGKTFSKDNTINLFGDDLNDDWYSWQGGFRNDWYHSTGKTITVQGDYYYNSEACYGTVSDISFDPGYIIIVTNRFIQRGTNLITRFSHEAGENSGFNLQAYIDYIECNSIMLGEKRITFDLDWDHHLSLDEIFDISWGFSYRYYHNTLSASEWVDIKPGSESRSKQQVSTFIQVATYIQSINLRYITGSKFEYNDYTGWEIQPSVKLVWKPDNSHVAWSSVARAVRTPSLMDDDISMRLGEVPRGDDTLSMPIIPALTGITDSVSEELWAVELGYRFQPSATYYFDGTAFFNSYENLLSLEPGEPKPTPEYIQIPYYMMRNGSGVIYGAEICGGYNFRKKLKLRAAYTYWYFDFDFPGDERSKGDSPNHQVQTGFSWDPISELNINIEGRYIGELVISDGEDYFGLDVRIGWSPLSYLEFSLVGQNLIESEHYEFSSEISIMDAYIERGIYGSMSWRF